LVAGLALGLTPLVFVITGFIFYLTAATYAEATSMYPEAGGSSSFARHAFNELWSFFAAWAQMLNYTITIAISAFFVPHYLGGVLGVDALRGAPSDVFFGMGVVVILVLVNVRGAEESAGVNIALAVTDFLTQVLLVVIGGVLVLSPDTLISNVDLGVTPSWKDFFLAIPVGMIAYTGIETISNMAEEARDETKTIPAAIKRVVIAVFAIYAALPAVALSALPVFTATAGSLAVTSGEAQVGDQVTLLGLTENAGGYAGDPILGVVRALDLGFLQTPGEIYVGLLAATILFIATNAGIIGVSRLVYSMGLHRQVPDRLRQLHPRYGTPWIGILVFGGVACLAMIPGKAAFLGNMYAFGAMLSFTIAHASVIRLRWSQPDVPRPYAGPGNVRFRGRSLPLFALVGGAGTGAAFVVVTVLHLDVAAAGVAWLALGMAIYPIYRRNQGLDLRTTTKIALPLPVTDREAEYESVLVALDASRPYAPGALATAVKVAARRRRGIYILVTIPVPQASPMDADLFDQELAAQAMIEQARLQGGRRVTGRTQRVRAGQAGSAIVDAATEIRARAIVLPLPPRTAASTVFGRTVETVLAKRPCRVIIQSDPQLTPVPEPEPRQTISAKRR
ncbi:MAG: universal stress protein, partial [Solirubrobacterales bacterium]|nr:universal stress protein [Solirubrobacterales bacterium]